MSQNFSKNTKETMRRKQPRDLRTWKHGGLADARGEESPNLPRKRTASEIQEDMISDPVCGPAFAKIFETHILVRTTPLSPVSPKRRKRGNNPLQSSIEIDKNFIEVLKNCSRKPYCIPSRTEIERIASEFGMTTQEARERFANLIVKLSKV